MDLRTDIFAEYTYGKLALQKMASSDPNFRLFEAEILGDGKVRMGMKVKGAVFRESTSGKSKGQLCIKVPGTTQSVIMTPDEMDAFKENEAQE